MNDEETAKLYHETYERLAPSYGYKNRDAKEVPWEDVPYNNKRLMIAVAKVVHKKILDEVLP